MSDTPNSAPAGASDGTASNDGVSMRKQRLGAPTPAATPNVPIPRTIDLAVLAVGLEAVFTLLRALALRGYTGRLSHWLVDSNNKATGKNKKSPYTAADVAHDLAQLRKGSLLEGLVIVVALIVLGISLRRVRGAGGARWALIILIILTSGPLAVVPVQGWPALPKIAGVLMGASSIAVIVLLLLPKSMMYFRACKAALRPAGAPARPGMGGLFGPRGAAAQRGMASGRAAAQRAADAADASSAAQTAEAANPARAKAKAKVRTDADAVAKGAELARSRAKASKSRRGDS